LTHETRTSGESHTGEQRGGEWKIKRYSGGGGRSWNALVFKGKSTKNQKNKKTNTERARREKDKQEEASPSVAKSNKKKNSDRKWRTF